MKSLRQTPANFDAHNTLITAKDVVLEGGY